MDCLCIVTTKVSMTVVGTVLGEGMSSWGGLRPGLTLGTLKE